MRLRGLKQNAFAGWLAMLALSIQALIPALLAAEISLAQPDSGGNLFTYCAFGHLHAAAPHEEGSGSSHHSGDDGDGALCPICLALLASPEFAPASGVIVPIPAGTSLDVVLAAGSSVPVAPIATAYRSRAPPLG